MYNITYQLATENANYYSNLAAYGGIVQIFKVKYEKK